MKPNSKEKFYLACPHNALILLPSDQVKKLFPHSCFLVVKKAKLENYFESFPLFCHECSMCNSTGILCLKIIDPHQSTFDA